MYCRSRRSIIIVDRANVQDSMQKVIKKKSNDFYGCTMILRCCCRLMKIDFCLNRLVDKSSRYIVMVTICNSIELAQVEGFRTFYNVTIGVVTTLIYTYLSLILFTFNYLNPIFPKDIETITQANLILFSGKGYVKRVFKYFETISLFLSVLNKLKQFLNF